MWLLEITPTVAVAAGVWGFKVKWQTKTLIGILWKLEYKAGL